MDDTASELRAPSRAYANYVLGVLVLVYVMNFVDRQLISILIEPIKAEFGASDAEMGILTGFAFAIFYTVAGIPVARLADLWVRRSVIAIGLAVWSAMTALTGLSRSFAELTFARIGVGVGEAGGTPPSHALLSDYFPPDRRATALGIFSLGVPIGTLVGYSLGGYLGRALRLARGVRVDRAPWDSARAPRASHGARAAARRLRGNPACRRERHDRRGAAAPASRSARSAGSSLRSRSRRSLATASRSGSRSS